MPKDPNASKFSPGSKIAPASGAAFVLVNLGASTGSGSRILRFYRGLLSGRDVVLSVSHFRFESEGSDRPFVLSGATGSATHEFSLKSAAFELVGSKRVHHNQITHFFGQIDLSQGRLSTLSSEIVFRQKRRMSYQHWTDQRAQLISDLDACAIGAVDFIAAKLISREYVLLELPDTDFDLLGRQIQGLGFLSFGNIPAFGSSRRDAIFWAQVITSFTKAFFRGRYDLPQT